MKSIVCKICGNADYFREKNGKLTCLFCGNEYGENPKLQCSVCGNTDHIYETDENIVCGSCGHQCKK